MKIWEWKILIWVKKYGCIDMSEFALAYTKKVDEDPLKGRKMNVEVVARKLEIMTAARWRTSVVGESMEV